MVQKNRSKEVWLVPKRGSLHQTICLIESLINRNYDQTRWNEQKQNNIGNDLRKRGAVREKRSPSNQSIRTLLASIPQYLGFLYIDSNTTPNTVKITDAGRYLYNFHKDSIENIGTLGEGKKSGGLIETSSVFLEQFEKLQITNPIILKDCENILVFPFRVILKLLIELNYLDREELAYFVFSIRDESEIPLTIEKIKKYRKQDLMERDTEIKLFKETHIGNITLVKASSASYFENLCYSTGIIERFKIQIPNPGSSDSNKLPAIKIKDEQEVYVKEVLSSKYENSQVYNFGNNLKLWVDYIGNPNRKIPPRDIEIENKGNSNLIIIIEQNGVMIKGDLIKSGCSLVSPMFINENYDIIFISPVDGTVLEKATIKPDYLSGKYEFNINSNLSITNNENIDEIGQIINEHSAAKTFDKNYLSYLGIIGDIIGADLTNNKNLRGAYYEYLFYKLLEQLREEKIIDDVYWNGKVGEFGLPRPAPGGKTGTPDIIFIINDEFFILELTTIKAKSAQFSAEGSSVPDHIKLFAEEHSEAIVNGIYTAPTIHDRNTSAMKAILDPLGINLKCIEDRELVDLLLSKDRNLIYSELKSGK
ncbi:MULTISPECIES: AlwI family type II restriction endonuclease [Bacillus cereus group]|uniref:AlwI family type II restriction endonuclease n=1 Tax=Bacillus cereus group TaxID=86661 RepID=UPI0007723F5C|nr:MULTISPECIES: AlwI family type II restriction endonuclease [Bacillus cereus group]KXI51974.1 AlwI family restriction endonuclease [Bacillus cereus]MDA1898279.1 AlwI family type II restriction endonuclease [Bacillus cereus group sp. BcHK28]MED1447362.1 AlwI family type II restriction endonuclease [Bacillus pacificus]NKX00883.1 AlwI family type II restriction endonuclease [Bacillus cereus]